MTADGQEAQWLRSFYLPETQQALCYFCGPSREAIEEVNRRARIPFTSVVEAQEMTPNSV